VSGFNSVLPFDKGAAVAQKTVTIVIDDNGNSEIDLDGFADNSCGKVFEDFRGKDKVKTEQKKAAFYTPQPVDKRTITGR
jgi:type I restriction-modification system DNA methylase subunit